MTNLVIFCADLRDADANGLTCTSFVAAPAMGLHSAIVMPYLTHYGTKDQQEKYLPAMTAGECIARCAIINLIMIEEAKDTSFMYKTNLLIHTIS